MDRGVRYLSDSDKYRESVSDGQRFVDFSCLLCVSVNEWMHREDRHLSPPLATLVCLCLLSLFCTKYHGGGLQRSPVYKPLRMQECFLLYLETEMWKWTALNTESKSENDAALVFKPYLSYRGNPLLNELHTGGLLEAPWSVNAYTGYWHTMLSTVMYICFIATVWVCGILN